MIMHHYAYTYLYIGLSFLGVPPGVGCEGKLVDPLT